jgi:hypothetical protein
LHESISDRAEPSLATQALRQGRDRLGLHGVRHARVPPVLPGTDKNPNGFWEAKLNAALYDTVLYTFSFYEKGQVVPIGDLIVEEFLDLLTTDKDFAKYITTATDTRDRVIYRIDVGLAARLQGGGATRTRLELDARRRRSSA